MKTLTATLLAATAILFTGASTQAAHHEEDMIKEKIMEFYGSMRSGDFEKAFSHIAIGSRGYVEKGMLNEIPTAQVRSMVANQYEEFGDEGGKINMVPKNIVVSVHGSVAVATFYADGTVTDPEEGPRHNVNRATLVWEKKGESWKIVHWHISALQADEED